ncbi:MAG: LysE family translocator [Lentilitoribacter sp.]
MDPVLFLSFVAATLVIVVSPGPSVALASSQAVRYGPKAAIATVAGDAFGSIMHIIVAVVSLQALLSVAAQVLPALQIVGGLYIVYLAYASFTATQSTTPEKSNLRGYRSAFISGFFACVSNPKAIVFFAALFPGFIAPEHSVVVQSLIYGAIFVFLDAAFIMGYALLAVAAVNSRYGSHINMNKLSAFGLLGVGVLLVYKGYRDFRPA